jgi:transglutaminase-like putative cysteine protease
MTIKLAAKKEPERSASLRLVVLAAMLIPLLAIARVAPLWPHVVLAAAGMSLGHWYSYRRAERPNQLLRLVMFIAIHLAIAWLCTGLFSGATVPQAQFAIFAQAITSFDLRYRSNLFNTLIHSLANLYVAASLSRTVELGLYLILFIGLVLAAFFIAEREDGFKVAKLKPSPLKPLIPRRNVTIFSLGFGLVALLAIFVVFIFTPRYASRPIVPPFSLNVPLRGGVKAQIINPGVPLVQINGWNNGSSDYFYGFDTTLDLRYRGGLSDELVMYVHSPSQSYWRSHSYDYYTGTSWQQSDQTVKPLSRSRRVHFQVWPPLGAATSAKDVEPSQAGQQIVQSFTLAKDQPNLIFAAYRPAEIYIVADSMALDSGGGLRLPENLKAGMTYSVVSYRPDFNPDLLRQAKTGYPAEISGRYLQLPANISGRIYNLAQSLTIPYSNNYDKVLTLTNHLLTNYRYNFFPPPTPPGAEIVDTFLFEDKEGVCEQYVTALVVMARSLGIPARLAAGYGSGHYNPITGYYEVKMSHAHSWAEVYFPQYGWVPFDPTPGWLPQPYPTPVQTWLFSNGELFGFELPMADLAGGGVAGLLFFIPFLVGVTLLVGLGLLVWYLLKRLRPAPTTASFLYSPADDSPTRRIILTLYQTGMALLARQKYRRRNQWETLAEYAQTTGQIPALTNLTQAAEIAAYRPEAPEEATVAEAKGALEKLPGEMKQPLAGNR